MDDVEAVVEQDLVRQWNVKRSRTNVSVVSQEHGSTETAG